MNKNVKLIVKGHLCLQCGTCESICPEQAIEIKEYHKSGLLYPHIKQVNCVNCGLCSRVCPVNDLSLYTKPLANFESIGVYSTLTNDDTDLISASGGAVTAILKFLFKKKEIDKAVVAMFNNDNIFDPEGVIIDHISKVDQARGSIYQPVALNRVLKALKKEDRVAFVGLPCHIKGITNYLNIKKELNIIVKIGIFCNIGRARNATRFLTRKYVPGEEIKEIYYRKGAYPGNLSIVSKEKEVNILFKEYMTRTGYLFPPKGCLFCDDLFNEKADISVGDPWGICEQKKALIIVRKRQEIITAMIKSGILKKDKNLTREEALSTQNYKHKQMRTKRSKLYLKLGIIVPSRIKKELDDIKKEKTSVFEALLSLALIINSKVFNSGFYMLAGLIPLKVLKKISGNIKKRYRKI